MPGTRTSCTECNLQPLSGTAFLNKVQDEVKEKCHNSMLFEPVNFSTEQSTLYEMNSKAKQIIESQVRCVQLYS